MGGLLSLSTFDRTHFDASYQTGKKRRLAVPLDHDLVSHRTNNVTTFTLQFRDDIKKRIFVFFLRALVDFIGALFPVFQKSSGSVGKRRAGKKRKKQENLENLKGRAM